MVFYKEKRGGQMQDLMIDLLMAALGLSILWGVRIAKKDEFYENYLSRGQTAYTKGALALLIVYHHVAQCVHMGLAFAVLMRIGGMLVSVFFFYSGYGLMKSYLTQPDYRSTYLRRRLPAVLIPYLLANVIYWLAYRTVGLHFTIPWLKEELSYGGLLVRYSWYVAVIGLFYVGFYFLMFLRGNKVAMISGAFIFLLAWDAAFIHWEFPEFWYGTSHILIVGMLWAAYEEPILRFIKSHYTQVIAVCAAAVAALFLISRPYSWHVGRTLRGIMYVFFVVLIVTLSMKISIGNKWLSFAGMLSFEIYLYQGLFSSVWQEAGLAHFGTVGWNCVILPATLLTAWLCRSITTPLVRKIRG